MNLRPLDSGCPPSPTDVQKEREASKFRLLGVWASLADHYTRRLDEDDIVDIRTGEMIDSGFLRKSRKVGAIAAPAAGTAIVDEGTTDEEYELDELDELDAFADMTDEVDDTEMGLRVKPVPPTTALNSADAKDLRKFLEVEGRRKHLCGSDVEIEEGADQNQESEDVEHEIVDLVSEDELDNWDVDESSVVVLKQITSPQEESGQHKALQESSRKRRRVSSDSDDEQEYNRKPSHSHYNNFQFPYHYPYPHHQSSPHRMEQRLQQVHHPSPPLTPIPDVRAQFIITQAMHQLSALVGTPWTPPHDSSFIHTPSRHHRSRRAISILNTPYHPHPHPYSYDPNLSFATLPLESLPESISSPEKLSSSHGPRKSSMARARSRSRGRQVSFKIDSSDQVEVYDRVDIYSSPSKPQPPSRPEVVTGHRYSTRSSTKGKGKTDLAVLK